MKSMTTTITLSLLLAGVGCASSGSGEKKEAMADNKEAMADKKEAMADEEGAPEKHGMGQTGSMIVKQTVGDFDAWKQQFDAHADPRKGMGVVWHSVSRANEDENVVITHFVGKDLTKMREFTESEGFKKAMESAGVTGEPTVWLANDVAIESPREQVEAATASMIVKHEVEDFAKWKEAFDGAKAGRSKSGIVGGSVSRNADDPNVVIVHMMGSDLEAMKAYATSDRFKQAMEASGVKGEPEIWFATDVDVKQY